MRSRDRLDGRVQLSPEGQHLARLKGIGRRDDEQPSTIRVRCRKNAGPRGVAEHRRLASLAKRVDDPAVALDDDIWQRARVEHPRDRASDAAVTDEHDMTVRNGVIVLDEHLRARTIEGAEQPRPPVKPALDRPDGGEQQLVQCYRKQRAGDDVALPLRWQNAEREAKSGENE